MVIHRMQLDDFGMVDYQLIGIYSLLEDYRLAYFLNDVLPIFLEKKKQKIIIKSKNSNVHFSRFEYKNASNDMIWHLIQNKNEIVEISNTQVQNLFFDEPIEIETKVFLLPEFKNIDYILKIDNADYNFDISKIIEKINTIDDVSLVYEIDENTIKSKNNLIF